MFEIILDPIPFLAFNLLLIGLWHESQGVVVESYSYEMGHPFNNKLSLVSSLYLSNCAVYLPPFQHAVVMYV